VNDRIGRLHAQALKARRSDNDEAERLSKESHAQTIGEPDVIRQAKAQAHHHRNTSLVIRDAELLVGSHASIEYEDIDASPQIFGRQQFKCFWDVPDHVVPFFTEGMFSGAGNHTTMDYETILSIGFEGLIERIDERTARLSPDDAELERKKQFLDALRIVAEGYIDFCRRYGTLAEELASIEADPVRKTELEEISRICKRVPAQSPTSFREAIQALWFCFFFLPDAPGRVDQYLYPYYKADLEAGAITPDDARELLSCLWLKYHEIAGASQAVSALHHLTLGGVKPDGNDASNDVTWLCLDVTEDLRLNRPQIGLRWNPDTPPELLHRALRVLRTHSGNPDFCNDMQIVPALEKIGVATEDARDFSLSGCHEVIVTGKAQMGSVEGFINLPKILRMTLGLEPTLDPGADLDAIESYTALWNAMEDSMEIVADHAHTNSIARDKEAAEIPGGNLCASLVVNDCIENTLGYTQGGARYNHCNWDIIGLANLADSLTTIRRLVFDEKELTLPQLVSILESDWEGHEVMRSLAVNRHSHFGNDEEGIDDTASRIIEVFSGIMKRRTPFRGGEYILGTTAGGENMHVEFGRMTGATPDGRLAGTTLADSVGAAHGRDRNGVTAMLNSVARLPHSLLPTATTLNVKLDPKLLENATGISKIAALLEAHFLAGGQQMQFNMVTREMLEEARRNPEEHAGLTVRVAGYSAPFTSLWEDLQDEVMARTGHEM
jgi:pyruvate-formate lyase